MAGVSVLFRPEFPSPSPQEPDEKISFDENKSTIKPESDYLVAKGVAADRLAAKGYGPSKPIADNKSAAGREKNRRVEFMIE